jgi:hypothetical protein
MALPRVRPEGCRDPQHGMGFRNGNETWRHAPASQKALRCRRVPNPICRLVARSGRNVEIRRIKVERVLYEIRSEGDSRTDRKCRRFCSGRNTLGHQGSTEFTPSPQQKQNKSLEISKSQEISTSAGIWFGTRGSEVQSSLPDQSFSRAFSRLCRFSAFDCLRHFEVVLSVMPKLLKSHRACVPRELTSLLFLRDGFEASSHNRGVRGS